MTVKQRYDGIQTAMLQAGQTACLFLCMLSIAEQVTNKNIDFIEAYNLAIDNDCMTPDYYMKDQEKLLTLLTGKRCKKAVMLSLPEKLPVNMYTVEKWYNPRTNFTHFKRRAYDTLTTSVTVREGKLKEYYTYFFE